MGRLVESPGDIRANLAAYPASGMVQPQTGLVFGYDFLTDSAQQIAATMDRQGLSVSATITDSE